MAPSLKEGFPLCVCVCVFERERERERERENVCYNKLPKIGELKLEIYCLTVLGRSQRPKCGWGSFLSRPLSWVVEPHVLTRSSLCVCLSILPLGPPHDLI
jgi:hypothetical protein